MFEYAALVDAPVTRFTGIVTESEPTETPAGPIAPTLVARPAGKPVRGIVASPAAMAVAASGQRDPMLAAIAPRQVPSKARPTAPSGPISSSGRPSLRPALIAVAAAGLTAIWWLRRDTHDRLR